MPCAPAISQNQVHQLYHRSGCAQPRQAQCPNCFESPSASTRAHLCFTSPTSLANPMPSSIVPSPLRHLPLAAAVAAPSLMSPPSPCSDETPVFTLRRSRAQLTTATKTAQRRLMLLLYTTTVAVSFTAVGVPFTTDAGVDLPAAMEVTPPRA